MLVGRIMLPFVFVFIYFMATSTTSQFLMSGVVEEKRTPDGNPRHQPAPAGATVGQMLGLGALC